jgi:hypothetical protein
MFNPYRYKGTAYIYIYEKIIYFHLFITTEIDEVECPDLFPGRFIPQINP